MEDVVNCEQELKEEFGYEYQLYLSNKYLNAPAGQDIRYNLLLYKVICIIGKKFVSGKGSDFSKGKRYIYNNVNKCSKRQIKLMVRSVPSSLIRDYNIDDKYIFRFADSYFEILSFIIECLLAKLEDDEKEHLNRLMKNYIVSDKIKVDDEQISYTTLFVGNALPSLDYVVTNGKTVEIRMRAYELKGNISKLNVMYQLEE